MSEKKFSVNYFSSSYMKEQFSCNENFFAFVAIIRPNNSSKIKKVAKIFQFFYPLLKNTLYQEFVINFVNRFLLDNII